MEAGRKKQVGDRHLSAWAPSNWQRPSQLPAAPGGVALRPMPNFDDRDAALLPPPPKLGAIRMQQQPFEWAGGSCNW